MTCAMISFDGNYKNVIFYIFASALTILKISTFEIFNLEKVGQVHRVLFSNSSRAIAKIEIISSRMMHFCNNSHSFRYQLSKCLTFKKLVKVMDYNFCNCIFKYQNLSAISALAFTIAGMLTF